MPSFGNTTFINNINLAILRYSGARPKDPESTETPSVNPLLETDLHPLKPSPVPGNPYVGGADVSIELVMGIDLTIIRYMVNGVSYVPPTMPVLLQVRVGSIGCRVVREG